MKRLLVAAALAPLTFAAGQASAQTITPGTSTAAPIATYTASQNGPISTGGNDIVINTGVTINPSTSGTAAAPINLVTGNSNNSITTSGAISNSFGSTATYSGYITGILETSGTATTSVAKNGFTIENLGSITLTEVTNYTNIDNGGSNDANNSVLGQFAAGGFRNGIFVNSPTAFIGSVTNAGTISIIGEDSSGITIGSAGMTGGLLTLAGSSLSITGGNLPTTADPSEDVSYGIHTYGAVGNAALGGTIAALGRNAIAVDIGGDVGTAASPGALEVYGTISASGYYTASTAQTSYAPSVVSQIEAQSAAELQQGGPALAIGGNVYGGISIDPPVVATGSTAAVAGAAITSTGSAPALLIGGANTITIGAYAATTDSNGFILPTTYLGSTTKLPQYGLILGGSISGIGLFSSYNGAPINATGVEIGGRYVNPTTGLLTTTDGAGMVTIANGIAVSGTVSGSVVATTSFASVNGQAVMPVATGMYLNNVSTPTIDVSGAVEALAVQGTSTTTPVPVSAIAINLGPQSQAPQINNTGSILASITGVPAVSTFTAFGGTQGYPVAILDTGHGPITINNSNLIEAVITPINPLQLVDTANSSVIAIDLSKTTGTATITQSIDPALLGINSSGVTTVVSPQIIGNVLFGSGNANLNLLGGTLSGGVLFGTGTNSLDVDYGAISQGALGQQNGGTLAISVGTHLGVGTSILDMIAPTANTLSSPSSGLIPTPASISLRSLTIGATGEVVFSVSGANSAAVTGATPAQFNLTQTGGSVSIAQGGLLGLNFASKLTAATTYQLIAAPTANLTIDSLSGANLSHLTSAQLTALVGNMPYLYAGQITLVANGANTDLALQVTQKTAQQLGLNPAEASAYKAIYTAFDATDSVGIGSVAGAVLAANTKSEFKNIYDQLMPDYSGGPFEDLVIGQQSIARAEADAVDTQGVDGARGWVQEIGYYHSRTSTDEINGYNGRGFGLAGGDEHDYGRSAFGVAAAFLSSSITDLGRPDGSSNGANVVEGGVYWRTGVGGFNFGASLDGGIAVMESRRVAMLQNGDTTASLYRLAKASWIGGLGSASVNLSYKQAFGRYYIKPELTGDYVMFYEKGYSEHGGGAIDETIGSKLSKEAIVQSDLVVGATYGTAVHWSPEMTFGWRQVVYGGPADVTANFAGGSQFKLSPGAQEQGGLMARLGVRASGNFADFSANAGGVFNTGYQTYDARASARFLF